MPIRMKGFAIKSEIDSEGHISQDSIMGNYDGNEAEIMTFKNGNIVDFASLNNNDIAHLLAIKSDKHDLVERLGNILNKSHHSRRSHTRRHHSRRPTRRHHSRRPHSRRHRSRRRPSRSHHSRRHHSQRRRTTRKKHESQRNTRSKIATMLDSFT